MLTRADILEFMEANKKDFFGKFNLRKMGLFGSYARGDHHEDSDIDILIEFITGTSDIPDKKRELKEVFKNRFHKKVDLANEKYLYPHARSFILQDVIYVKER